MGRNLTWQILRGSQANLTAAAMPLAEGEFYFAEDTGNLYVGIPGVGCGYVQIGDMSQVNATLQLILNELRASRLALSKLACDGGGATPTDFDPDQLAADGQTSS